MSASRCSSVRVAISRTTFLPLRRHCQALCPPLSAWASSLRLQAKVLAPPLLFSLRQLLTPKEVLVRTRSVASRISSSSSRISVRRARPVCQRPSRTSARTQTRTRPVGSVARPAMSLRTVAPTLRAARAGARDPRPDGLRAPLRSGTHRRSRTPHLQLPSLLRVHRRRLRLLVVPPNVVA